MNGRGLYDECRPRLLILKEYAEARGWTMKQAIEYITPCEVIDLGSERQARMPVSLPADVEPETAA